MMNAKQFQPYLDRDGACYRCGTTEGLVPQHRINRGNGGRTSLDIPSNIITFCGLCNGLIEADSHAAENARAMGWKLRQGSEPALAVIPVYDRSAQTWFFLDDGYHRTAVG
jgi:hypothetical protein